MAQAAAPLGGAGIHHRMHGGQEYQDFNQQNRNGKELLSGSYHQASGICRGSVMFSGLSMSSS